MVSNGAHRANSVAANDAFSLPVDANTRPFKLAMPTTAGTIADDYPLPRRGVRWLGLVFFIVLHVVGIVGTPRRRPVAPRDRRLVR